MHPNNKLLLQANEDHKLPGIDAALSGLHGLVQEYLTELSIPKPEVADKEEMVEVLKPDPTVRESHNVEVSVILDFKIFL